MTDLFLFHLRVAGANGTGRTATTGATEGAAKGAAAIGAIEEAARGAVATGAAVAVGTGAAAVATVGATRDDRQFVVTLLVGTTELFILLT